MRSSTRSPPQKRQRRKLQQLLVGLVFTKRSAPCREQLKELAELDKESRKYGAQLSSALAKAEELRKGNSAVLRAIADDRLGLA